MTVSDLREKLLDYNQAAKVDVIAENKSQDFSLTFGGCDGGTKQTCENVSFYVDALNQSESA